MHLEYNHKPKGYLPFLPLFAITDLAQRSDLVAYTPMFKPFLVSPLPVFHLLDAGVNATNVSRTASFLLFQIENKGIHATNVATISRDHLRRSHSAVNQSEVRIRTLLLSEKNVRNQDTAWVYILLTYSQSYTTTFQSSYHFSELSPTNF